MEDSQAVHPLHVSDNIINERGVMVFSDINRMPAYNEPYVSPYLTITLNIKGFVKIEYDMHPIVFKEHEIAIVHPNHTICAQESSPDYHAILIAISPNMVKEFKNDYPSIFLHSYQYAKQPHFHLSDEQFTNIYNSLKLIESIEKSIINNNVSITKSLLRVFTLLLQEYKQQNGLPQQNMQPNEALFNRFYEAIVNHYSESREVRFYASMFCLSPKHFATIIKEQTGINAHKWINNYVIIQAKSMLRYNELNIQQVALRLGFPDQTTFSRFFKNIVGISPNEYRKG